MTMNEYNFTLPYRVGSFVHVKSDPIDFNAERTWYRIEQYSQTDDFIWHAWLSARGRGPHMEFTLAELSDNFEPYHLNASELFSLMTQEEKDQTLIALLGALLNEDAGHALTHHVRNPNDNGWMDVSPPQWRPLLHLRDKYRLTYTKKK